MISGHRMVSFSRLTKTYRIIGVGGLMLLAVSCVTTRQTMKDDASDRIRAENSQFKQHIPLIERENDVLKRENLQYQTKVRNLSGKIESLQFSLNDLNQKYDRAVTANQEQIRQLQEEYTLLEDNSFREVEKSYQNYDEMEERKNINIQVLEAKINVERQRYDRDMDLNKEEIDGLREKYALLSAESAEKIKQINQQLEIQKADFQKMEADLKQRHEVMEADLKQRHEVKEKELLNKISELSQEVNTHEIQIVSLKTAQSEISGKLNDAQQKLNKVKSERDKIKKKLDDQKSKKAEFPETSKNTLN